MSESAKAIVKYPKFFMNNKLHIPKLSREDMVYIIGNIDEKYLGIIQFLTKQNLHGISIKSGNVYLDSGYCLMGCKAVGYKIYPDLSDEYIPYDSPDVFREIPSLWKIFFRKKSQIPAFISMVMNEKVGFRKRPGNEDLCINYYYN